MVKSQNAVSELCRLWKELKCINTVTIFYRIFVIQGYYEVMWNYLDNMLVEFRNILSGIRIKTLVESILIILGILSYQASKIIFNISFVLRQFLEQTGWTDWNLYAISL